jgi:hypothetical protein
MATSEENRLFNGQYQSAEEYADALLPHLPAVGPFIAADYLPLLPRSPRNPIAHEKLVQAAIDKINYVLIEHNYAESVSTTDSLIKLTPKGREARLLGGHTKCIEEQRRIKDLKEKQVQSVIDTNEMQRNVLWITIGISVLTLFVTFYSAWKDKPINVFPSKVIIQQTRMNQDSMKQQRQTPLRIADSLHPSTSHGKK